MRLIYWPADPSAGIVQFFAIFCYFLHGVPSPVLCVLVYIDEICREITMRRCPFEEVFTLQPGGCPSPTCRAYPRPTLRASPIRPSKLQICLHSYIFKRKIPLQPTLHIFLYLGGLTFILQIWSMRKNIEELLKPLFEYKNRKNITPFVPI